MPKVQTSTIYSSLWQFKGTFLIGLAALIAYLTQETAWAQNQIPTFSVNIGDGSNPDDIVPAVKIILLLTVLSVAPAILLMTTSFTRIIIVLSFVRQALGTQTMPPNQVLVGLALFLTFFTMSPLWEEVRTKAVNPYLKNLITTEQALEKIMEPMKTFMLRETREEDLGMFLSATRSAKPENAKSLPISIVIPAFMVSELKTAFQIGFLIYIPFLIIDMVVSSVLMAMGMLMLPPTVVSLPFKLVLFVLVDGWSLVVDSLIRSFQIFG